MYHEGQFDRIGSLACQSQSGNIVIAGDVAIKTDFYSKDYVPVLLDGSDGEFRIGIAPRSRVCACRDPRRSP